MCIFLMPQKVAIEMVLPLVALDTAIFGANEGPLSLLVQTSQLQPGLPERSPFSVLLWRITRAHPSE